MYFPIASQSSLTRLQVRAQDPAHPRTQHIKTWKQLGLELSHIKT